MDAAVTDKTCRSGSVLKRKLESRTVKLPNFDAEFDLSPEGAIQRAALEAVDGKLSVQITPRGEDLDIAVTAGKGWMPPIGPQVEFTDFSARAVVSRNQVRVEEFRALLYGGAAKGSALINWGGPWSIDGQLIQHCAAGFDAGVHAGCEVERAISNCANVGLPELTLFDAPRIDATFVIRKGGLDGVDLVRALQTGGRPKVQGGSTWFEEISGALSVAGGRYQYRNLKLASGLLSATGGFEVSPNKDVNGTVFIELRSQAAQIRGNFIIDGNLKAVVIKPPN
jgi:hypothetical protein